MTGRVTAILEVSTGFNPLLTGRENIRRRLMLYGFSPYKVNELECEIIDFAELSEVIDNRTLTYSSGMAARLAFSVVTSATADTVLIDEILMVGDERFQGRCIKRIASLAALGRTVVLASHATTLLERLCDKCIWMKNGKVHVEGTAHETVSAYLQAETRQHFLSLRNADKAELNEIKVNVSTIFPT